MNSLDKSRESRRILIYTLVVFFLIVLVFPIVGLFTKAFYSEGVFTGFKNFKEYFTTPALLSSFEHSITVSIIASVFTIVIAFIFAYGIERSNIKFKKILNFIALLPLFIPTMTHAIALIYLIGENGIISTGFFGKFPSLAFDFPLYGKWGVIIAECFYVFPAIYMMFSVSFKVCDFRLYEAAEVLGTSKFRKFFTITLPSVKYTVISAFFAAFTMVFSDFGIPKVLGGDYNLLATDIYNQVIGQSNITMGATVGILLVIPSIISFLVDKKISKSVDSVDSSAKDYIIGKNKIRDSVLGGITYLTSTLILILVTAVIAAAFIEQWPYDLSFTFKWFKVSPIGISTLNIFINTIFVALISSVLGTIIAILAAYVTERGTGFDKIRKALDWFGILPLAIPGLVIGVSYLLFFNQSNNPLRVLYGTFVIMIFANGIHFFSMPYMTIKGSMKKIDKEYENVSETMGIPWYAVFDRVILPLSKQAILESFQYYFLNSMVTISALVFLYTTRTNVAAVEMVSTYDEGYLSSTAAIAVLILLINIIVKYGITFYNKRKDISERDKEMEVYKILQVIQENEEISQRGIATQTDISLGKVNYIMRDAIKKEYIKKEKCGSKTKYYITDKGFEIIKENIETLKDDVILISRDSDKKIKNAVILAAGFQKEFDCTPAGLKVIGGSVIKNAITKLKRNGIEKIYVVTGYGEDKIKKDLKEEKDIMFISSNNYKNTGSMTSLALIDDYIDDDFILLEGDILFEERALIELLNSSKRECIVLTEISDSGDEEFVQSKQGYIFKLGKDIHQFNRVDGELVGISKISYKLYQLMMREYKENMNPLLNYEYILLDVSKDFKVFCLNLEGLSWGEIDNLKQYNLVKDKIFK